MVDDPSAALDALVIGQAQQEIGSQLAVLSDYDAKLAAVTAGTLVLIPLMANITFPIGLALAVPLAFSAGWSTWGLFIRRYEMGPHPSVFFDDATGRSEREFSGRSREALLTSGRQTTIRVRKKTRSFTLSGLIFLGAGIAAALLFAIQVVATQRLPAPLKASADWWTANSTLIALIVLALSICWMAGVRVAGKPRRPLATHPDGGLEVARIRGLRRLDLEDAQGDDPVKDDSPLPPLTAR